MSEARKAPDLGALGNEYEILSELRGGDDLNTYVARAREGGEEVEIAVVRPPAGGDNNALAHFASDTQMLSSATHPNMVRVVGGKWLGNDAYAVVRERVQGPSLSELMSGEERPSYPRVGTILQQANGVLQWARETGVVHRGITPTTLLFAQRTNNVMLSLAPTPIPMEGIPDACADMRTVSGLAWFMITGEEYPTENAEARLNELRPDLAARVRSELLAGTQCKNGGAAPDVDAFIGVIAMADALKAGEDEITKLRAELAEQLRVEREKWEAEQRACDEQNAELARTFAAEKEQAAAGMAREREKLSAERKRLEEQIGRERTELKDLRARVKEQFATLDARRIDTERAQAAEAERLRVARAEFEQLQAEQEQRNFEVARALRESQAMLPIVDDDGKPRPSMALPEIDEPAPRQSQALPPVEETEPLETETPIKPVKERRSAERLGLASPDDEASEPVKAPADEDTPGAPSNKKRWIVPGVAGGLILMLVAGATAIGYHSRSAAANEERAAAAVRSKSMTTGAQPVKGGFLNQSSGNVAPLAPFAAPGTTPVGPQRTAADSIAAAAAAAAAAPKPKPRPKPRPAPVVTDSIGPPAPDTLVRPVTIARTDSMRSDTVLKRGGLVPRDSFAKPDSLLRKPDSVRRDTTVRRDSIRPPGPPVIPPPSL